MIGWFPLHDYVSLYTTRDIKMTEEPSINNVSFNTSQSYNMATATNEIMEFKGSNEEDANVWLRDILLITKLGGFTEEGTIRDIILKLRDASLSWAFELI